jgi:hypothetical protein
MSRFSTTVSTIAALGTIAATSITAYKVFDSQQTNSQKQQLIIEDLKQQLEAKKAQPMTPPAPVVSQPMNPSSPLVSGSASVPTPPPLPPVNQ